MGGFSLTHWIIILVIVLIVMGPRKLPELGKGLGEAIRGFKKGLNDGEIDVTPSAKRESLKDGDAPASNASQQTKDRGEA